MAEVEEVDERTAAVLAPMREALLRDTGRIQIVKVIFGGPGPYAVQVLDGRKKVGPLLFPGDDKDLSDVMALLGKVVLGE